MLSILFLSCYMKQWQNLIAFVVVIEWGKKRWCAKNYRKDKEWERISEILEIIHWDYKMFSGTVCKEWRNFCYWLWKGGNTFRRKNLLHLECSISLGTGKKPQTTKTQKPRPFKSVVEWIALQIVIKCEIKH